MDLITLLNDPAAELPLPFVGDYRATLARRLEAYRFRVSLLCITDAPTAVVYAARERVGTASDALLRTVDAAMAGDRQGARAGLDDVLAALAPALKRLRSREVSGQSVSRIYRVRPHPPEPAISLGGIFHLDGANRGHAKPARYSVAGLPSLYLSRSVYICWREVGCPSLDELWVSAFQLSQQDKFRVLDFGWTPELIADMLRKQPGALQGGGYAEFAAAYAIAWPLIAACSAVRGPGSGPHPEYLVPQLLLDWLTRTADLIGVRYFSTREAEAESPLFFQNYVFPAADLGAMGYSPRLCKAFSLTSPVLWSEAAAAGAGLPSLSRNNTPCRDGDGTVRSYHTTEHARVEAWLERAPLGRLSP